MDELTCFCGYKGKSRNGFGQHLRYRHNLHASQFHEQYLKDRPLCECGCGNLTNWDYKTTYTWFRYLPGHNIKNVPSDKMPRWKGGRVYTDQGYIQIRMPEHPKSYKGYIAEHIVVAEMLLGRYLEKGEIVHHINHIRDDNRPENLQVMTQSEHMKLHARERRESKINGKGKELLKDAK